MTSSASLMLLLDALPQEKEKLLIGVVQVGIDLSIEPERLAGALDGLAIGLAVKRLADPGIDAATFTQSATLMLRHDQSS